MPAKQTTRMRKAECATCGYTIRVSRAWIAVGMPSCPCGAGELACDAIEDCALAPDSADHAARLTDAEWSATDFAIRSEREKRKIRHRRRCVEPDCSRLLSREQRSHCAKHEHLDPMPF